MNANPPPIVLVVVIVIEFIEGGDIPSDLRHSRNKADNDDDYEDKHDWRAARMGA